MLTLAQRHDPQAVSDPVLLQWLFWLSNTLHVTERMIFYPQNYAPNKSEGFIDRSYAHLDAYLEIANSRLPNYLIDNDTIIGVYLAPLLRRPALYGAQHDDYLLANWPRLYRFAQAFEKRAYAIAAAQTEGLGQWPISAPVPPNPPEGKPL